MAISKDRIEMVFVAEGGVQGRKVADMVGARDLGRMAVENQHLGIWHPQQIDPGTSAREFQVDVVTARYRLQIAFRIPDENLIGLAVRWTGRRVEGPPGAEHARKILAGSERDDRARTDIIPVSQMIIKRPDG